ncbi:hypothetical protein [Cellulomonas cellasea]|uniref:Uncharacterized protein n=1 Tax=Cellulomonas cellasea TaxID=43670 RepID=A0A7W4UDN2_9CELL|nr:hypothetical protein [Cellulomonas cellasea]MBB2922273.1 hypothetical protein [Cellulomonas cellasea]
MRFTFEVELDDATPDPTVLDELGRALRYWAGNLKHYPLTDGQHDTIRDSSYTEVGEWRLTRGPSSTADAAPSHAAEVAPSHAAEDHPGEASAPS